MTLYGQNETIKAQEEAAASTAAQLNEEGKQTRALAYIELARLRQTGRAQRGEQQSLLADSGFAAEGGTDLLAVAGLKAQQTLEEKLMVAQNEDIAKQKEFEARTAIYGGQVAKRAGKIAMASTLLQSASWSSMFGAAKAPTAAVTPAGGGRGLFTSTTGAAPRGGLFSSSNLRGY